MALPKEFTTVTTTSKLISLILFITLPFIAFSLGIRYQQSINSLHKVNTYISPTIQEKSMNYIFHTFVRGNVCAFRIGSDPNKIDPNCKYWSVNSNTGTITELPASHPYLQTIFAQQARLNNQLLQTGGCTDSANESICVKGPSQDNENIYLYTLDLKNNQPISAYIQTVDTNPKETIISNVTSTGCEGEITAWSEQAGEILFTSRWNGTPNSPSGEMLKSICIYNYKNNNILYKKLLPVDMYNLLTADMINGQILLYNNRLIHYRTNEEETIPVEQNQTVIYDEQGIMRSAGLILLQSKKSDAFIIEPYSIEKKAALFEGAIPKVEKSQNESLRFITLSEDKKHLMFERIPSVDLNTQLASPCKFDIDLSTYKTSKVACGYQFQSLYPFKTPPDFDHYVYADFLDWY